MAKKESGKDVYADHTVSDREKPSASEPTLSPSGSKAGAFKKKGDRPPGFAEVPGAGPNPSSQHD